MARKLTHDDWLTKAKQKHGEKFDYSHTRYVGSHEVVEIICPSHGVFRQKAYHHLAYGCRKCAGEVSAAGRKMSVDAFVERAARIHNGRYDYRHVSFERQHDKIRILCPVHGAFDQAANDHLKGHGCVKCGSASSAEMRSGPTITTETFVSRARDIHNRRYDYSGTVYRGAHQRLNIRCEEHGDFEQFATNHLAGMGCPSCATEHRKSSADDFLRRAREVHGDRYDYVAFAGIAAAAGIVCNEHGYFEQIANDHLGGHGCPFCAHEQTGNRLRLTADEISNQLFAKFSDHIQFDDNQIIDLKTPACFSCLAHGDFEDTPLTVLSRKHACPKCGLEHRSEALRLSFEEFEARARDAHGDRYRYGAYVDTRSPVEVFCGKHGRFLQSAGNHLSGYGCPKCGMRKRDKQTAWLNMMGIADHEVPLTIGGRRLKVDGYDPSTRTIYEFWGDFWHGNPDVYESDAINTVTGTTFGELWRRTQAKRRLILDEGYKLIEIWENDWRKIREGNRERSICPKK